MTQLPRAARPSLCEEVQYEEPVELACGDVHDKCTRNYQRTRIADLVWDVEQHFLTNGP